MGGPGIGRETAPEPPDTETVCGMGGRAGRARDGCRADSSWSASAGVPAQKAPVSSRPAGSTAEGGGGPGDGAEWPMAGTNGGERRAASPAPEGDGVRAALPAHHSRSATRRRRRHRTAWETAKVDINIRKKEHPPQWDRHVTHMGLTQIRSQHGLLRHSQFLRAMG